MRNSIADIIAAVRLRLPPFATARIGKRCTVANKNYHQTEAINFKQEILHLISIKVKDLVEMACAARREAVEVGIAQCSAAYTVTHARIQMYIFAFRKKKTKKKLKRFICV